MMFNDASCKRLAHDLEVGGSARRAALEGISGHVRALSFDSAGCHVVQQAMKVSGADVATGLAKELEGSGKDAAYSPYANYVLQRIVEALPHSSTSFVAEELLGVAANVSQHRFGCRILCRLFEHCAKSIAALSIADELMTDILALSRHEYGHYVLQALVEHGSAGHRRAIAQAFVGDLAFHVEDGSTSYVLESIFMHCAEHEQRELLVALLRGGPHVLDAFTCKVAGIRVLRALVKSQGAQNPQLLTKLLALAPQIRACSQGHRLLQEMKQANLVVRKTKRISKN